MSIENKEQIAAAQLVEILDLHIGFRTGRHILSSLTDSRHLWDHENTFWRQQPVDSHQVRQD